MARDAVAVLLRRTGGRNGLRFLASRFSRFFCFSSYCDLRLMLESAFCAVRFYVHLRASERLKGAADIAALLMIFRNRVNTGRSLPHFAAEQNPGRVV